MNYRDWLQQVIYKIINPVVRGMIKIGITPNFITTTGLILNIVAAGIFIYAGLVTDSEEDLSLVGWTGGLILFAGQMWLVPLSPPIRVPHLPQNCLVVSR